MVRVKFDPTDFALGITRMNPFSKAVKGNSWSGEENGLISSFSFKDKGFDGKIAIDLKEARTVMELAGTKNDANMPNSPESTNFTLAEFIKREYALSAVFSKDVAKAHRSGDLQLHKLGMIDRPYCSGQNLEYIKKFGLNRYSSFAAVKPAAHIDALLDHMLRFSMALRARFSGAIGWDAVNLFLAPYLGGMGDDKIRQFAQKLIYQFNQTTAPIGAQPIFSDMNLYWEVPQHFANVPAIGPRGEYTGKKYKDYQKEAQAFVWQLFNVYLEGDASGAPFFWPKPNLHLTENFWQTEGHQEFLEHACRVASKMGNTYFIFDRGSSIKISECCRVSFELAKEDLREVRYPWRMRYNAAPYVTPNLPRLAYRSQRNLDRFFELLGRQMDLVFKAHLQKQTYLKKLLDLKGKGPLAMLAIKAAGEKEPFLRFDKMSFLVGVLGISDAVKFLIGKSMDESDEALKLGLKIVAFMKGLCDQASRISKLKFVLEQDPAESTAYRFAKLDLASFPKETRNIIHGDLNQGYAYYTNSTHLDVDASVDPVERIIKEGLFHPLIEGGNITHIWLGEHQPSAKSLANLVRKAFFESQTTQIAFSPEFTICRNCGKVERGLLKSCRFCGSRKVDGITRITGYYTFVSGWNKGKLGELRERKKTKI